MHAYHSFMSILSDYFHFRWVFYLWQLMRDRTLFAEVHAQGRTLFSYTRTEILLKVDCEVRSPQLARNPRFTYFRPIQFWLLLQVLLQVPDFVHVSLILVAFGVETEHFPFTSELIDNFLPDDSPLLFSKQVDPINVVNELAPGKRLLDLSFGDRIGILNHILYFDVGLAVLNRFQLIEELEQVELVGTLHLLDVMPQAVHYPHSQSHHRILFLANYIVQESFNKFHWKRIEKERNEPLEDPCFVGDLRLFDLRCCFGHPFVEQAPEEPTIDFGQRKSILV